MDEKLTKDDVIFAFWVGGFIGLMIGCFGVIKITIEHK